MGVRHKKLESFGEIPEIPRKVVGIVALDVIESYGPIDMVNFTSPDNADATQHFDPPENLQMLELLELLSKYGFEAICIILLLNILAHQQTSKR